MLFRVASELKCGTVEELRDRMLASELTSWMAYFEVIHAAEKKAAKEARNRAKSGAH